MIITVTLNPAIDRFVEVENYYKDGLEYILKSFDEIGGKGINVSKFCKLLGEETTAVGFLGGESGENIKLGLNNIGIENKFTDISNSTRINTKVLDSSIHKSIELNQEGPIISEDELNKFINSLKLIVKPNDIVVFSGGVSKSLGTDIYFKLINIIYSLGAKSVLDSSKEWLKEGVKAKPFLIKPNVNELEDSFNVAIKSNNDIVKISKEIIEKGVSEVLVSNGDKGCVLVKNDKAYIANSIPVKAVNTICAGDSLLSAYIIAKKNSKTDIDALKYATAVASIVVSNKSRNDIDFTHINEFIDKVKIIKV